MGFQIIRFFPKPDCSKSYPVKPRESVLTVHKNLRVCAKASFTFAAWGSPQVQSLACPEQVGRVRDAVWRPAGFTERINRLNRLPLEEVRGARRLTVLGSLQAAASKGIKSGPMKMSENEEL
jgi:hypothetical protein